jgi:hypothetical protein
MSLRWLSTPTMPADVRVRGLATTDAACSRIFDAPRDRERPMAPVSRANL